MAVPQSISDWRKTREYLSVYLRPGVRSRLKSKAHAQGLSLSKFLEQVAENDQWPDHPVGAAA